MQDLEKSPLCAESDIQVYRPSLDFFINKINKNEYFSFTRQMHGLWDAVIGAWILEPALRNVQLSDKAYREKLANAMSIGKQDVENLYYEPQFYVELLEIIIGLDNTDANFFFGISDTHFFRRYRLPIYPNISPCLISVILNT